MKIVNGSKPLTISTKGSILLCSKCSSAVYETFVSLYPRDDLLSTYAKFSAFSTPLIRVRTCAYKEVRNVSFLVNFVYVQNE